MWCLLFKQRFLKAVTGYHSQLVTKADTDLIDRYFQSKHMEGWNTRLVKKTDGNKVLYVVRLASLGLHCLFISCIQ